MPPTAEDWVLSITDGSDLASGITHPTAGVDVTVIEVSR
jgi:hypothetical protein